MLILGIVAGKGGVVATGGTTYTQGGYKYHLFSTSGTFSVTSPGIVEVLLVAGGGGGGGANTTLTVSGDYSFGGGGGAGGLLSYSNIEASITNYSITVGTGGALNNNGTDSSAFGYTAIGGGAGSNRSGTPTAGGNGGSGGGAGITFTSGIVMTTANGTGTAGQGTNGGSWAVGTSGGGGRGGGAVSAGNGPTGGGAGSTAYTSWFNTSIPAISSGGRGGRLVSGLVTQEYGDGGWGQGFTPGQNYAGAAGANGVVVIRYSA